MRDAEDNLSFEQEVGDGWAVMVSAGKWHDTIGLSNIWGINPIIEYIEAAHRQQ